MVDLCLSGDSRRAPTGDGHPCSKWRLWGSLRTLKLLVGLLVVSPNVLIYTALKFYVCFPVMPFIIILGHATKPIFGTNIAYNLS